MTTPTTISASQRRAVTWTTAALIGLLAALGLGLTLQQIGSMGGVVWAAAVGDEVPIPGGTMRIEEVMPEHLDPMNHGRFASLGMTMQAMVPDSTPEGQRTFSVLVTLIGQGPDGLQLSAEQFTLSGGAVAGVAPLRSDQGRYLVPPGSGMTALLVYRVPVELESATMRYAGGMPVVLTLGKARAHH